MLSARVDLKRLFGEEPEVRGACMQRIAIASGGHLRDLTNLMKRIVRFGLRRPLPISLQEVEGAILEHGATRTLLKNNLDILLEVSKHGDLGSVETKDLGACAGAMDAQLLLYYWNGSFWYDTHPIIATQLEQERAERARTSAAADEPRR